MSWIVKAIVQAVMGFVRDWFNAEKAKADEWNAAASEAKLEASIDSRNMEQAIRDDVAAPAEALTFDNWNEPREPMA